MNLQNFLASAVALSLAEADERTASLDGTSIDIQDYEGVCLCILNSGAASAGTTPTLNCKIQHSDDDSTFADLTGATFTEVTDSAAVHEAIAINASEVKRYIKLVGTIAGSEATFDFGASFVGCKKAS